MYVYIIQLDMVRICAVVPRKPPNHGSSFMAEQFIEAITSNGDYKLFTINSSSSGNLGSIGKLGIKKIFGVLLFYLKFVRVVSTHSIDIVFIYPSAKGAAFYRDLPIILLSKFFGMRVVSHFHNRGLNKCGRVEHILKVIAFYNTDAIVLSERLRDEYEPYFMAERIHILPNGIPDMFSGVRYTRNENVNVRLLFMSNLLRQKGIFILLECLGEIFENSKFDLFVAGAEGDVSYTDIEDYVVEKGMKNNVKFLGYLEGEEKFTVMEHIDIFVFPSYYHYETFGLVNLEAMMCEKIVVASNIGGVPDYILHDHSGYLIESGSKESLKEVLVNVISNIDDIAPRVGTNARKIYLENYTLEQWKMQLFNILKLMN